MEEECRWKSWRERLSRKEQFREKFLKLLKNSVVLPKLVSSEYKDIVVNPISKSGQRNGTTVYIKRVPQFTGRDGVIPVGAEAATDVVCRLVGAHIGERRQLRSIVPALINDGFYGMGIKKDLPYDFSTLARQVEGSVSIRVELIDDQQNSI